jgi:5-oxoprolinase (ATP-hydrolysing) subunit A
VRQRMPSGHVHVENIRPGRFSQMSATVLDLNADLGEGIGDDDALLAVVTSANVACGFHAGDEATMRAVAATAAARGVAVGAHVAYRDREGFGRRPMSVPPETLAAEVREQIEALEACCRDAGTRVRYVKPHGALYNQAARDAEIADAVCGGVAAVGPLPVLGLPGGELLRAARDAGLRAVPEGFPDRAYHADGSLAPRDEAGALIEEPAAVAERAVALAQGTVEGTGGAPVHVTVRSLCVHGDAPQAVAAARAVREALEAAGVRLEAFAA